MSNTLPRHSLGGQNSRGRPPSGARSSRAASTIFKRLRKLDRRITKLDDEFVSSLFFDYMPSSNGKISKILNRRKKLDEQRKQVRAQRKVLNKP